MRGRSWAPSSTLRGAQAHLVADLAHRFARDRAGLGSARREHFLDLRFVVAELDVLLTDGREVLHHRLRDGDLEMTVLLSCEVFRDVLGLLSLDRGHDLAEVCD